MSQRGRQGEMYIQAKEDFLFEQKIQMASESFSGSSGCRQSEGMTVGIHPRF